MKRGAIFAAMAVALVIAAIVLLPRLASPTEVVSSPSATASPAASPSASLTPTPSPTPTPSASATVASGRFVNAFIGYSIQLTSPWRRSGCLSSLPQDPARPDIVGIDGFTSVPAVDEQYGDTGGPRGTVSVRLESNPGRLTAEAWARSPRMAPTATSIEPATLDGRPGVRTMGFGTETTFAAVDDLMYSVELSVDSANDPRLGAMRAIVATFAFVPRVVTPSATARAPRSAEAVADGLADAFARKDATALASLMGDCVVSGAEQAGAGAHSPEHFTQIMRDAFVAGSTYVVRPRPIEPATGFGTIFSGVSVASTWTQPGRAPARVDLIIAADGAFNYWRGMITRQLPPP